MPSTYLSPVGDVCPASVTSASDVVISALTHADLPAVQQLHETVFGPGRFARTAYRIREGAPVLSTACCKIEIAGVLKGAVQMTWVKIGSKADRGMLLGPLAICQHHARVGHGMALIRSAIEKAAAASAQFVILVGDLPYYEKTGFERVPPGTITLPGPVDPTRLLIRQLVPGTDMPVGALQAVVD